ncbi:MAG: beta-ketoacyl synthase chain length factor, partial [Campylobacter sp.]|nr:beta-ketoacyl synthase chain length factor [Campylobacter sp.]
MPKISFDIKFLNYFVSDKIAGNKDFEQSFDLSHIPPLQRRRYSTLAKCLFSKMPEFSDECVIVYASHTGEINRCLTLLKELKDTELISPVSFSLSVLNSAPALVAIEKQNHNEITAISS